MDRNMKTVPDENRNPGLSDTEIDDGFAEAIAKVMGADDETLAAMVLPSGASDVRFPDRLPENIFPDWLPENIRDTAGLFLRHAEEEAYGSYSSSALAMIERLIYDPQMKAVWTQLLQKSRATGGFRLAVKVRTMFGRGRADEIHYASTIVVFRDAFTFGMECLQFAEQKRTHYLGQAEQLRSDARLLERMLRERRLKNLSPRDVHRIAKRFDDAADAYQELGNLVGLKPRPTDPEPFDPDLFDPEFRVVNDAVPDEVALTGPRLFDKQLLAKRFAVNMAATMRGLFGADVMYGTVARITRVVFDDDETTDSAVREWCAQEAASPGSGDNEKLIEQLTAWRHMIDGNLSELAIIRARASEET
jgi:hypothetical protein